MAASLSLFIKTTTTATTKKMQLISKKKKKKVKMQFLNTHFCNSTWCQPFPELEHQHVDVQSNKLTVNSSSFIPEDNAATFSARVTKSN